MRLTPHEQERLLIRAAADLARQRRARGLRLNYPEAVAVLAAGCWRAPATGAAWPT